MFEVPVSMFTELVIAWPFQFLSYVNTILKLTPFFVSQPPNLWCFGARRTLF